MNKYMIGQRVIIVDDCEIATITRPKSFDEHYSKGLWVRLESGVVQYKAAHNIKPLPNGQL